MSNKQTEAHKDSHTQRRKEKLNEHTDIILIINEEKGGYSTHFWKSTDLKMAWNQKNHRKKKRWKLREKHSKMFKYSH